MQRYFFFFVFCFPTKIILNTIVQLFLAMATYPLFVRDTKSTAKLLFFRQIAKINIPIKPVKNTCHGQDVFL